MGMIQGWMSPPVLAERSFGANDDATKLKAVLGTSAIRQREEQSAASSIQALRRSLSVFV